MKVNEKLEKYIQSSIFPQYKLNGKSHDLSHIKYVIQRCNKISKNYDINFDMLYTIAAYHDIGHHIDAKNHEKVSAKILSEDKNLESFFSNEEIEIMKEAVEDHRASLEYEPRSIYGKIISSADRNTNIEQPLIRSYYYRKEHFPNMSDLEIMEGAYEHLKEKFGVHGYAKCYIIDEEYEKYLKDIRELLSDKELFFQKQQEIINKVEADISKIN